MPTPPRTASERWRHFVVFVIVWVLAAAVASAVLFYFTGDPAPRSEPSPPTESELLTAEEPAPEPKPPPVQDASTAPPPTPARDSAPPPESRRRPPSPSPPRARVSDSGSEAEVGVHIRRAAEATKRGDYEAAIRDYESALELDPNNFEVEILLSQVTSLRELEAQSTPQRFEETPTELTDTDASRRPSPAELIIELLPAAPNPGDPYVVRVRAQNMSNEALSLESMELVETHDSMRQERGRAVKPLARRLGPKENALLWEKRNDWSEADRHGAIVVAVTLADGSRLSKSVRW